MKKRSEDQNRKGAGSGAEQSPTEIPTHDQELVRLKKERDELEAKLQRAMADLQNFRRRQLQELEEVRRRTLEGMAHELLPVLDNFKLALQSYEEQSKSGPVDASSLLEGLQMVQSLLGGALERHGLSQIPAQDQPFDPNLHEAVGVEHREDIDSGRVTRVLQEGYTLADRVIRPSKVMVSGTVADKDQGGADSERRDSGPSDDEEQS